MVSKYISIHIFQTSLQKIYTTEQKSTKLTLILQTNKALKYITSWGRDLDSGAVGDFPESEDLTHEQVSLFPDDVFNVMRIRREGGNSRQRQGREDAVGSKPLGLETHVDGQKSAQVT